MFVVLFLVFCAAVLTTDVAVTGGVVIGAELVGRTVCRTVVSGITDNKEDDSATFLSAREPPSMTNDGSVNRFRCATNLMEFEVE